MLNRFRMGCNLTRKYCQDHVHQRAAPSWPVRMRRQIVRSCEKPLALSLLVAVVVGCSSTSSNTANTFPAGASKGFKVGSPYVVNGIEYQPGVDYEYNETGIASWYGPGFHGKLTANGETYDMNALTAAHTTLPMPSLVLVTNLENGRSLKLRVNDRGPFANGRIIDVSRRAAQLLGFHRQGTARVRVEILADESRVLAGEEVDGAGSERLDAWSEGPVKDADAPLVSRETLQMTSVEVEPTAMDASPSAPYAAGTARTYIQAGAFRDRSNAERVQRRLAYLGAAEVSQLHLHEMDLFRVRLGPFVSGEEAEQKLAEVISAGFAGSILVFE